MTTHSGNRDFKVGATLGLALLFAWAGSGCVVSAGDEEDGGEVVVTNEPTHELPDGFVHVDEREGSDANSGLTADEAFQTITYALANARSGETVVVAPGVYDITGGERFPLMVPPGVHLVGDTGDKGDGSEPTLIEGIGPLLLDGMPSTATITMGAGSSLGGFTVFGLGADESIVVDQPGVTVDDDTIRGNSAGTGILADGNFAGAVIEDNDFESNQTGLSISGNPSGSAFSRNGFGCNGLAVRIGAPGAYDLENSLWDGNPSGEIALAPGLDPASVALVTSGARAWAGSCS